MGKKKEKKEGRNHEYLDNTKTKTHLGAVPQEVVVRGQLEVISPLKFGSLLPVRQEPTSDLGTLFQSKVISKHIVIMPR